MYEYCSRPWSLISQVHRHVTIPAIILFNADGARQKIISCKEYKKTYFEAQSIDYMLLFYMIKDQDKITSMGLVEARHIGFSIWRRLVKRQLYR